MMIYIGIGANLPSQRFATPRATCEAALRALKDTGTVTVAACSHWYESAPVPASDQPWFVNAVARLETDLSPRALLDILHTIEADFGRVRTRRNAPRVLDLDLLVYNDMILHADEDDVDLPHPRMTERAFVLLPLAEIAPHWRHPISQISLESLIARMPREQICCVQKP